MANLLALVFSVLFLADASEVGINLNVEDRRPNAPVQDDLSYKIIQTIKGSYTAIGPLQVSCPQMQMQRGACMLSLHVSMFYFLPLPRILLLHMLHAQCESACQVREPKATCEHDVPSCALDCAAKCTKGNNMISLYERICLDGCMLFCEFVPPPGIGSAHSKKQFSPGSTNETTYAYTSGGQEGKQVLREKIIAKKFTP